MNTTDGKTAPAASTAGPLGSWAIRGTSLNDYMAGNVRGGRQYANGQGPLSQDLPPDVDNDGAREDAPQKDLITGAGSIRSGSISDKSTAESGSSPNESHRSDSEGSWPA